MGLLRRAALAKYGRPLDCLVAPDLQRFDASRDVRIALHDDFRTAFGTEHAEGIRSIVEDLHAAGFASLHADLDTPCERYRGRSLNRGNLGSLETALK